MKNMKNLKMLFSLLLILGLNTKVHKISNITYHFSVGTSQTTTPISLSNWPA